MTPFYIVHVTFILILIDSASMQVHKTSQLFNIGI